MTLTLIYLRWLFCTSMRISFWTHWDENGGIIKMLALRNKSIRFLTISVLRQGHWTRCALHTIYCSFRIPPLRKTITGIYILLFTFVWWQIKNWSTLIFRACGIFRKVLLDVCLFVFVIFCISLTWRLLKSVFTALSRKRISLKSMLGVYIVLSAGLAVALVTLAAEIYWKRTAKHVLTIKVQTGNRRLVRLFYQGFTL